MPVRPERPRTWVARRRQAVAARLIRVPSSTDAGPGWAPARVAVVAWAIGALPTVLRVGVGRADLMSAAVEARGMLALVVVTVAWSAASVLVPTAGARGQRWLRAGGAALLLVASVEATASSIGRSYGLAVATSLLAAHVLTGEWVRTRAADDPAAAVPLGLLLFGAIQALWVLRGSFLLPMLGSAAVLSALAAGWTDVLARRLTPAWKRAAMLRRRWPELAVVGVTVAAVVPVIYRFASTPGAELGSIDYATHLEIARSTGGAPLFLPTPHPIFHVLVYLLSGLVGEVWATTIVLSSACGLMTVVLLVLARRPLAGRPGLPRGAAIAFALGYWAVESPAVLAHALQVGSPYDWSPSLHMYLSPTDTISLPFALALLLVVAGVLDGSAPLTRRTGWTTAAVATASTLAKPSMAMAVIAALPFVLVVWRSSTWAHVRFLATWLVVPCVAIGLWQAWFIEVGGNDLPEGDLVVRPLEMVRLLHLDEATPLLYSALLVVGLCMWVGARRYLASAPVVVALCAFMASVAMMLLLNEGGARRIDGTFTKPAFTCGVVLAVVSWRYLLGEVAVRTVDRRRPPAWLVATVAFAALSLAAGVIAHLDAVGAISLVDHSRRG